MALIKGTPGNDILVGTDNSDIILGLGGVDTIDARAGDDTIDTGLAKATVEGGFGIDTWGSSSFTGDTADQTVAWDGGTGFTFTRDLTPWVTVSGVERIAFSGGVGDDSLSGGAYGDRLDGGAGNDTLTGNGGDDTLLGGAGGDVLYGDDGNDSLQGGAGLDYLYGGDGDDTLGFTVGTGLADGGDGYDRLVLGPANGSQTVLLDDLLGTVTVNGVVQVQFQNIESVQINTGNGTDVVQTGAGDDIINTGNANDVIHAGAGTDTLLGGNGNDLLDSGTGGGLVDGGKGTDTWQADFSDQPVGLIFSVNTLPKNGATLALAGPDITVKGIEAIDLVGSNGNDNFTGGKYADQIDGGLGNDVLYGLKGNDVLLGGGGTDSLLGGDGNDILTGGAGDDTLNGGKGRDSFVFEADPVANGVDTLNGFILGTKGDVLDFTALGLTDDNDLSDQLFFDVVGGNTNVYVDVNGGGDSFVQVATLTGVTGLDLNDTANYVA